MAEVCVIHNPMAGRGKAATMIARLRRLLGSRAEFWPTCCPGDGEALAARAAQNGFRVIAAAGGDGTVHEVANGLLSVESTSATLAVLPVGSANDYAFSLGLHDDWWRLPDPSIGVRAVDVGVIRDGGGRRRYFVNCLGIGFNGHVTREARRIRGLRGIPLYGLALLRAMRRQFRYPLMKIRLDGNHEERLPTLSMTLGLGQREGAFPLTPKARLDDQLFDYLHVGQLSRLRLIRYFPRMISGRIPSNDPAVRVGQCRRVEVESDEPLMTHGDGEFYCVPEDGVRQLTIELIPGRLRVLGRIMQGSHTS
jgi:diacylglycerol kinase family enzyme